MDKKEILDRIRDEFGYELAERTKFVMIFRKGNAYHDAAVTYVAVSTAPPSVGCYGANHESMDLYYGELKAFTELLESLMQEGNEKMRGLVSMKNWEFYKEFLRTYGFSFAMVGNELCSCDAVSCDKCTFDRGEAGLCDEVKVKFLYQEHKEPIVLTDDEKALCKLLKRGYIARDKDGGLWWYEIKPTKRTVDAWRFPYENSASTQFDDIFPQCKFDFIKWEDEEPWEVQVDDKL